MSSTLTNAPAVPLGVFKQFGPHGPEYEVMNEAPMKDGRRMARIVLIRTGEEVI